MKDMTEMSWYCFLISTRLHVHIAQSLVYTIHTSVFTIIIPLSTPCHVPIHIESHQASPYGLHLHPSDKSPSLQQLPHTLHSRSTIFTHQDVILSRHRQQFPTSLILAQARVLRELVWICHHLYPRRTTKSCLLPHSQEEMSLGVHTEVARLHEQWVPERTIIS